MAGAKERGIHTCLDTSGIMFPGCGGTSEEERERLKKVERLLSVTDLVMLDIKHMDAEEHRKLTGQDNEKILAFARYLDEKQIPVWIRHVVVPGITFQREGTGGSGPVSCNTFKCGKAGGTSVSLHGKSEI